MSENNTVKPSVHKLSLKTPLQRPQTEGYEKDDNVEVNLKPLTANNTATSKPTLNLGASSYIPKSMTGNVTENKPATNWEHNQNANASQLLTTNAPSFTPKMQPFNPNMANPGQQNVNVPINNSFPAMGQSKKFIFTK